MYVDRYTNFRGLALNKRFTPGLLSLYAKINLNYEYKSRTSHMRIKRHILVSLSYEMTRREALNYVCVNYSFLITATLHKQHLLYT